MNVFVDDSFISNTCIDERLCDGMFVHDTCVMSFS